MLPMESVHLPLQSQPGESLWLSPSCPRTQESKDTIGPSCAQLGLSSLSLWTYSTQKVTQESPGPAGQHTSCPPLQHPCRESEATHKLLSPKAKTTHKLPGLHDRPVSTRPTTPKPTTEEWKPLPITREVRQPQPQEAVVVGRRRPNIYA